MIEVTIINNKMQSPAKPNHLIVGLEISQITRMISPTISKIVLMTLLPIMRPMTPQKSFQQMKLMINITIAKPNKPNTSPILGTSIIAYTANRKNCCDVNRYI